MATPDQIPTDLTIELGDDLSPEDFVAAVRDFMGYVSAITESQKADGEDIFWTVRVRDGSALVGVEPGESTSQSSLARIYTKAEYGINCLAQGDIAGSDLSDKAVHHLKKLSELAARQENGLNLWVKRKPTGLSKNIVKKLHKDWKTDYYDFGTIEGRLEAILDASGSLKIRVRNYLFPRAINCVVPEQMIEDVFRSFRKRVEIDGRIHYRRDGTPISIEASTIDVLPEDENLPTADDVRGIMANV